MQDTIKCSFFLCTELLTFALKFMTKFDAVFTAMLIYLMD